MQVVTINKAKNINVNISYCLFFPASTALIRLSSRAYMSAVNKAATLIVSIHFSHFPNVCSNLAYAHFEMHTSS